MCVGNSDVLNLQEEKEILSFKEGKLTTTSFSDLFLTSLIKNIKLCFKLEKYIAHD